MRKIFRKNLKCIDLGRSLKMGINNCNCNINHKSEKKLQLSTRPKIGELEQIGVKIVGNISCGGSHINETLMETLKFLNKFGVRRNVTKYTIDWTPGHGQNMNTSCTEVFNELFLPVCNDEYPLSRSIKIIFDENHNLFNLAKLFKYLNNHYQQLFVNNGKFFIKQFERIEIKFKGINSRKLLLTKPDVKNDEIKIFGGIGNQEYPIDTNAIQIKFKDTKQGIEYFAIIWQNVFDWLKRKQERCPYNKKRYAFKGCKVVTST